MIVPSFRTRILASGNSFFSCFSAGLGQSRGSPDILWTFTSIRISLNLTFDHRINGLMEKDINI